MIIDLQNTIETSRIKANKKTNPLCEPHAIDHLISISLEFSIVSQGSYNKGLRMLC